MVMARCCAAPPANCICSDRVNFAGTTPSPPSSWYWRTASRFGSTTRICAGQCARHGRHPGQHAGELLSGGGSVSSQFDVKALPPERRPGVVSTGTQASGHRFPVGAHRLRPKGELASMFLADKLNQVTQLTFMQPQAQRQVCAGLVYLHAAGGSRCDRARSEVTGASLTAGRDGTYRPLADRLRPNPSMSTSGRGICWLPARRCAARWSQVDRIP
jgi:hypothetical protein